MNNFNERLRQVVFFIVIAMMGVLIFLQIQFIIPGILGAVTVYVLTRKSYFRHIYDKKWPRFWTALLFTFLSAFILVTPFAILITVLAPKINTLFSNSAELYLGIQEIIKEISLRTGLDLNTYAGLQNIPGLLARFLPQVLGTASNALLNTGIAFFILYFLLYNSSKLEQTLLNYMPLRKENIHRITGETKGIVTSYAIGIPVLAISQGIAAFIGYWIFGIQDPILWAFATCVCAVIPVIGSPLIVFPLVVYLFASHQTGAAIGLGIYGVIVIMQIDNVLRLILLKVFADIHPLITLFGVIVGLKLFGFIGLIFGPLFVSYFLLLLKIYAAEFAAEDNPS